MTVTGRLILVATTWLVWFSVTFGQPSFSSSFSSISTIMAEAHQRDVRDDQDRQRTVRQETTKSKAGTLPLNMSQTAVHREERLEFAPVQRVQQAEFSKEEGRESAPTSRDPGDDQLSEYDDERKMVPFVICRTRNSVSFFALRRTRSGRIVKTTNKALLWT